MTTQPQTEQEILKKELEKIAKAHDLGDPTNISKSDNKYFKTWEGYSELIINAVAGNLEPEDYTVFPTIKEIEQALKSAIHDAVLLGQKKGTTIQPIQMIESKDIPQLDPKIMGEYQDRKCQAKLNAIFAELDEITDKGFALDLEDSLANHARDEKDMRDMINTLKQKWCKP